MLKQNFFSILFFIVLMSLFSACNKDSIETLPTSSKSSTTDGPIIFDVSDRNGYGKTSVGSNKTILGRLRENAFTVENMAVAHNELYGTSLQRMETTDLYVKFQPSSVSDLNLLFETDETFYDFPLEYEVVEMGDYYQELEAGAFPVLFAIVEPDFPFPPVTHEVVAELYLNSTDPVLVNKSLVLTNNTPYMRVLRCLPECPAYPECLIENISCGGQSTSNGGNTTNGSINSGPGRTLVDCEEGHPDWPECMMVSDDNSSTGGSVFGNPYTTNDCGCQVYKNSNKPGGCVKVEDTELSTAWDTDTYKGVKKVKVIVKDTWFTERETWTDQNENGCWKISKSFSGNLWMWVKFKNELCQIRGTSAGVDAAIEWMSPIKDYVGKLNRGDGAFNNIAVNYHMWQEGGVSEAHRYWGAATVNNALHEFHAYAQADGINTPPKDLDIFIARNRRDGFAVMDVQHVISGLGYSVLTLIEGIFSPFGPLTALIGSSAIEAYLPQVQIGVDWRNSDQLKRLAYHEFAHASHFTQVSLAYWTKVASAEIAAGGHGTEESWMAGIIEVAESWAEYLGHVYNHNYYGSNASITRRGSRITWEHQLERLWNEKPNHIPIGLHHDLVDVGEPFGPFSCDQDAPTHCSSISDVVDGFTRSQMFSCLTSGTDRIEDYQNCLISNHLSSTGNNVSQVDNLFNSY